MTKKHKRKSLQDSRVRNSLNSDRNMEPEPVANVNIEGATSAQIQSSDKTPQNMSKRGKEQSKGKAKRQKLGERQNVNQIEPNSGVAEAEFMEGNRMVKMTVSAGSIQDRSTADSNVSDGDVVELRPPGNDSFSESMHEDTGNFGNANNAVEPNSGEPETSAEGSRTNSE